MDKEKLIRHKLLQQAGRSALTNLAIVGATVLIGQHTLGSEGINNAFSIPFTHIHGEWLPFATIGAVETIRATNASVSKVNSVGELKEYIKRDNIVSYGEVSAFFGLTAGPIGAIVAPLALAGLRRLSQARV